MGEVLLETRGLTKFFPVGQGIVPGRPRAWIKAVDGVELFVNRGETLGLVGESGCGKTTTAKLILLLYRATAGSITFEGQDVYSLRSQELQRYRASVQAVFQDPFSSLNPRMRIGDIIGEPLIPNNRFPRKLIKARVAESLVRVGLRPKDAMLYPHEFSGGQRQRIALARAMICDPALIVLDEPVSALDVSIRAQMMNFMQELQQSTGVGYLLIAHDLAAVKYMSDRIGVMYLGKLVESGAGEDVYADPLHPYTRALLSAALPSHPDAPRREVILSGEVPSPLDPPSGCRFHPRCWEAKAICSDVEPALRDVGDRRQVACHL